ncbi:hypothetical protein PYW07_012854 [Mythimna separata]|uniref:Carboxylesterase type B domain-containing protein n=1 Tax=Mythimna separata TaxID=271217 RepID=A0AAD8DLN9_MYTSE|nr:hypothetical protein PYW07_012854 [Mythimna separata]
MFVKVLCLCILTLNGCVLGNRFKVTETWVDTTFGKVQGLTTERYAMFVDIPYGIVNESNPFGNAHPYIQTTDSELINRGLRVCPQHDKGMIVGKIQCLQLHIYKPNVITPGDTLPVMVYIHGFDFSKGTATRLMFKPDYLVRHNVILVTVDYRLGPYGHLCLPYTEYNNQALKDQNLALQWIKKHIGSFGGDSNNILLFGQDSGSVSVEYHLLYSKEILFSKVILQSGVVSSTFWNQGTDVKTFVKDVGLDSENIDVEHFIKTISAIDTDTVINITKFYNFRPCIDGEFITDTRKMRNLQNIKVMIGGTSKEMLYYYPTEDRYDNFDIVAELNQSFSISKMADYTDAIDEVKHFYLEGLKVNIVDLTSDLAFNYPMDLTIKFFVQNKVPVYRYLFSYDGNRNYIKKRMNVASAGSIHGDELGYLFVMPSLKSDSSKTNEEDQIVTDRMSLMWTNFAKYGDPTPHSSKLLPVKWLPITTGAEHYLQIDSKLHLHSGRPFEERLAFWDQFYEKYGEYAKGMILGEEVVENGGCGVEFRKVLLLVIGVLLVWL